MRALLRACVRACVRSFVRACVLARVRVRVLRECCVRARTDVLMNFRPRGIKSRRIGTMLGTRMRTRTHASAHTRRHARTVNIINAINTTLESERPSEALPHV